MLETAAYTAEEFVADVLRAMESPAQAQELAEVALKRALGSPILLSQYSGQMAERLEFHLVQRPQLAIKVFSMNPRQPKSPPHDHGGMWGLYGAYQGVLGMSFYRETENSSPQNPVLAEGVAFRIRSGETVPVSPEAIHSVWAEADNTVVLTIYNGDLNNTRRRIFDLSSSRVVQEISRWEERLQQGGGSEYKL